MTFDGERALVRAYKPKPKRVLDFPVWLSTDDTARYLGVAPATLHRIIVPDGLPCYRFGRVFRFKLDDVRAYIDRARVAPNSKEQQ